jgi:hypothetical protein
MSEMARFFRSRHAANADVIEGQAAGLPEEVESFHYRRQTNPTKMLSSAISVHRQIFFSHLSKHSHPSECHPIDEAGHKPGKHQYIRPIHGKTIIA